MVKDFSPAEMRERIKAIDTPDGHQTLIRAQWRDFASFAWKHYLSEGRGAIVIDMSRAGDEGKGFQVPSYYVADQSEKLARRGGWPSSDVAEVVADYDPELDVVFIFLTLEGDWLFYLVSDELTPPQAYDSKAN
ncbi:MAG TPA: hypothetical protein VF131_26270 [Blastocatellia bacterium]|nr:hypothetical protein [Blastocatellia bacterium]